MPPPPPLTPTEWRAVVRRVYLRALELKKDKAKAHEVTQAAIAKSLEPETAAWNPAKHKTFEDYLCDLAWSHHGNESTSYRVVKASFDLADAPDHAAPSSSNPAALALKARETARAERMYAALQKRIEGDALILLLLEPETDDSAPEPSSDSPGDEMPADVEEPEPARVPLGAGEEPQERRPNAEAASTRRALAKGYSAKEIEAARKRLKRHAQAVAREEREEP
jgi:hypothetical protein